MLSFYREYEACEDGNAEVFLVDLSNSFLTP